MEAAPGARRARIMEAIGDGVLLLAAAPERVRSNDVIHPYRQDSDFGYVTGFPEADAVCLLAPGADPSYVLFVQPHDPERAIWVGQRAGVGGATERYGAGGIAHVASTPNTRATRPSARNAPTQTASLTSSSSVKCSCNRSQTSSSVSKLAWSVAKRSANSAARRSRGESDGASCHLETAS